MNNKVTLNDIVGDLAAKYPQARDAFENLGIDSCCGGRIDLRTAAMQKGISPEELVTIISVAIKNPPNSNSVEQKNWLKLSLTELADHIEAKHHTFMKQQLPRLENLLSKVTKAHGKQHGQMLAELQNVLDVLATDIEMHLDKEEQILFPYVRLMDSCSKKGKAVHEMHCGTVQNPIQQMEFEHKQVAQALTAMKDITSNFQLPEDACNTFAALYDGLKALEADLHQHIHLENNVLFPRAVEMENQVVKV